MIVHKSWHSRVPCLESVLECSMPDKTAHTTHKPKNTPTHKRAQILALTAGIDSVARAGLLTRGIACSCPNVQSIVLAVSSQLSPWKICVRFCVCVLCVFVCSVCSLVWHAGRQIRAALEDSPSAVSVHNQCILRQELKNVRQSNASLVNH